MKKIKNIKYENNREYIYNKDLYLIKYINDMLNRCYAMFNYENLPDSITKENIEKYLLLNGHCIFINYENKFYVFDGIFTGLENVYHKLHQYLVNNVALNINKTFETEENKDCVLIENTSERQGLYHIFAKYGVMLNDIETSINLLSILNRIPYIFTTSDDKTKQNTEIFIQRIKNGEFSIIADNAFIESFKTISLNNTTNKQIMDLIELNQYIKACSFNDIGINANWNAKRERLNTNEISLNEDALLPLIDNMLENRKKSVEAINEKYGLNIKVELANIWKQKQQEMETTMADLKDKEENNESNDNINNNNESTNNINENEG